MNFKIHHYGLATNNFDKSVKTLTSLGYSVGQTIIDPVQKVKLAFAARNQEPLIEIISDIDDSGPTKGIIARTGSSFYHVCYEVADMEKSIEELRPLGFMLRHKPVAATAFNNRKIAWVYERSIGLVELLKKE